MKMMTLAVGDSPSMGGGAMDCSVLAIAVAVAVAE
jgi:hypothetical protein